MEIAVIIAGVICALCYGYLLFTMVQFMYYEHKRNLKPITKSDLFDEKAINKCLKDIQDLIVKNQPKPNDHEN